MACSSARPTSMPCTPCPSSNNSKYSGFAPARPGNGSALTFRNKSDSVLRVVWIDYNGRGVEYASIRPGRWRSQYTYDSHVWVIEDERGCIWGTYTGPTADLDVRGPGDLTIRRPPRVPADAQAPKWGVNVVRGSECGVCVRAHKSVRDSAVAAALDVIRGVLSTCSTALKQQLQRKGCTLVILGARHTSLAIPGHRNLKHSLPGDGISCEESSDTASDMERLEGRLFKDSIRAYGATQVCPVFVVSEDCTLMDPGCSSPHESLLVFELAHAVLSLTFQGHQWARLNALYADACAAGTYPPTANICRDARSYFAHGTLAWFGATMDVHCAGGACTRAALAERDNGLAAMLAEIYGAGGWSFPASAPPPFAAAAAAVVPPLRKPVLVEAKAVESAEGVGVGRTCEWLEGIPELHGSEAGQDVDLDAESIVAAPKWWHMCGMLKGKLRRGKFAKRKSKASARANN